MDGRSRGKELEGMEERARQYVLAKLSDEQVEEFDLLLLEDLQVQQLLEDVEGDLCEEYLFKHLRPDDRKGFEENYLQAESHLLRLETIRCMHADRLLRPSLAIAAADESTSKNSISAPNTFKVAAGFALFLIIISISVDFFIPWPAPPPGNVAQENVNSNTQSPTHRATVDNKNAPGNQSQNVNQNHERPGPQRPARSSNDQSAQNIVARVELAPAPKMGGQGSQTTTLPLTASAGKAELVVRLKDTPFTSFSPRIESAAGTPVPVSKINRTREGKTTVIVIQVDVSRLGEGLYTLSLSGLRNDRTREFINYYPFQVERR